MSVEIYNKTIGRIVDVPAEHVEAYLALAEYEALPAAPVEEPAAEEQVPTDEPTSEDAK